MYIKDLSRVEICKYKPIMFPCLYFHFIYVQAIVMNVSSVSEQSPQSNSGPIFQAELG
jgi:hypothetical protein